MFSNELEKISGDTLLFKLAKTCSQNKRNHTVWLSCSRNQDTRATTGKKKKHTHKTTQSGTLFFNYFYKSENALQQLLFLLFHFDDYDDTRQENVTVCRLAVIALVGAGVGGAGGAGNCSHGK